MGDNDDDDTLFHKCFGLANITVIESSVREKSHSLGRGGEDSFKFSHIYLYLY